MNYQRNKKVHLTARDEGKLKLYESCCDLRAWSHDSMVRDQYIKEWMKSDMPICMIPFNVIFEFWNTMTYKKKKFAPRCYPDCRSKDIIKSIYVACNAATGSLKNDKSFEKFFEEEEFETSHWPYEKCMEPLKNIRMFWKIIAEKIFHIKMPKNEEIVEIKCDHAESMRSIIKDWERDILEQIAYAKKMRNKELDLNGKNKKKCKYNSAGDFYMPYSGCSKSTLTDINCLNNTAPIKKSRRSRDMISRYASIKVKTADVTCETETDLGNHSNYLDILEQKLSLQKAELKRLNRENRSLRIELNSTQRNVIVKKGYHSLGLNTESDMAMALPLPFDSCLEDGMRNDAPPKDIDSEMIITMKNCKNDKFKHISLLQVVHKTNKMATQDVKVGELCRRKEYPLHLLNSVNKTFSPILRRELAIASAGKSSKNNINVHASFRTLSLQGSNASIFSACSSHFMSTKNSSFY